MFLSDRADRYEFRRLPDYALVAIWHPTRGIGQKFWDISNTFTTLADLAQSLYAYDHTSVVLCAGKAWLDNAATVGPVPTVLELHKRAAEIEGRAFANNLLDRRRVTLEEVTS